MSSGGTGEQPDWGKSYHAPAMSILYSFLEGLMAVPVLRDPAGRRQLVALIEDELQGQVVLEEHPAHRLHLIRIVDACRKHPNGLQALAKALRIVDPESLPMQEVFRRLADVHVLGIVPDSERALLRSLIEGVEAPLVQQAYLAAAGSSVRAIRPYSPNGWEAYEDLEAVNAGPDGLPPCMVFVERIAVQLGGEQTELLRAWNDRQAVTLGLERELRCVRDAVAGQVVSRTSIACLVIQLAPYGREQGSYVLSHWWQLDARGWHPERGEDRIVPTAEAAQREVESLVADVETALARFDGEIIVEFVLPRELLGVRVEEWVIESDTDAPTPLGIRYPLVLRSLERMRRRDWHRRLRQRWKRWKDNPAAADTHWCRPDGNDYHRRLERRLMSDPQLVSMVLSSPPQPQRPSGVDEVLVGLRSGLPAIIWHREDCGRPAFHQSVLQLMDGDLTEMPERVEGLRGLGNGATERLLEGVVILLDDPNRLLEPDELPGIAS